MVEQLTVINAAFRRKADCKTRLTAGSLNSDVTSDMVISSQAPTLCRRRFRDYLAREYSDISSEETPRSSLEDDDIVHPFRKLEDKCNQLVTGSNPVPGARKDDVHTQVCY